MAFAVWVLPVCLVSVTLVMFPWSSWLCCFLTVDFLQHGCFSVRSFSIFLSIPGSNVRVIILISMLSLFGVLECCPCVFSYPEYGSSPVGAAVFLSGVFQSVHRLCFFWYGHILSWLSDPPDCPWVCSSILALVGSYGDLPSSSRSCCLC